MKYLSAEEFRNAADREFVQKRFDASGKTDWSAEREWRICGDLDLAELSTSDLYVFVDEPQEAAVLQAEFPYRTIVVPQTATGP